MANLNLSGTSNSEPGCLQASIDNSKGFALAAPSRIPKRSRIGVDLDNVIAGTEGLIRQMIYERYHITVSTEDFVDFNYRGTVVSDGELVAILKDFHEQCCSDVLPLPGAVSSLQSLYKEAKIDIVTSRPLSSLALTLKWLAQYRLDVLGAVIFCSTKLPLAERYFAFAEDNLETAVEFAKHGVAAVVFDYPWNRTAEVSEGIRRVADWQQAYDVLAHLAQDRSE